MSTDVDAAVEDDEADRSEIDALAASLGEAIADTPEHRAYAEAQQDVKASDEAQERIQEFEDLRHEFMLARQAGEAGREDLLEVQSAQEELHSLPVMKDYLEAQEALENRLQAINESLSAELAIDFGEIAGACCHDE